MYGRPRCREWTPLATQQLRLRSLIQIVGYNIRPPEWCTSQCSFYLTLHHTTMSAPFYTSERISSPHPKWKEIESEITQRMSSVNVVIRIWCHIIQPKSDETAEKSQDTVIQTWGVYFSGLRYIGANLALNFNSDCFKSNTLVFQMHGGYFCSYKSLKLDIIPAENEVEHGSLSSDSSGRTNLSKTLETRLIQSYRKEARSISPSKSSKRNDKEYSKSHSPVDRGFKHNFPTMKTSASVNINQKDRRYREDSAERNIPDPNYIYEHSPESLDVTTSEAQCNNSTKTSLEDLSNSKIDLSETAESYDLRNEVDRTPKYRYLALSFLKSEIRPSYNADKLQKLHLLQYSIKKKQEAVQEIKERIYSKSALASTPTEEIRPRTKSKSLERNIFSTNYELKSSSQSDLRNGKVSKEKTPAVNGPRLGLKLNDLLSFKVKPSPFQRAEHIRMTKQLEILRFKRLILAGERDSKLANIRQQKERRAQLCEHNQDAGVELMELYHTLSRRAESLRELRTSCCALRELAVRTHSALQERRVALLQQLQQIFCIDQGADGHWRVCGIPLAISTGEPTPPGTECGTDPTANAQAAEAQQPAAEPQPPQVEPRASPAVLASAAAGLAAQIVVVAAAILNQPLRYKITLMGSNSTITDITPDLPDPNIPLYSRGGVAPSFALYRSTTLLSAAAAQLSAGLPSPARLARAHPLLLNLRTLMLAPQRTDSSRLFGPHKWLTENQCPRTQSLRSLVASERGKSCRQFNRFKDCINGKSPSCAMHLKTHRHSRSVGSYHDDQELPHLEISTTSVIGSEPDIYSIKSAQNDPNTPQIMHKHNSDSEISRFSIDTDIPDSNSKVVFILGDDTKMINLDEKLVRISTNNDDEFQLLESVTPLEENVKRICTEIKDFCTDKGFSCEEPNVTGTEEFKTNIEIENVDIALAEFGEQNPVESKLEEDGTFKIGMSERDGECDIDDSAKNTNERDIVIESSEGILDAGFSTSEVRSKPSD